MPRTVQEILAQADELAQRFENFEPDPDSAIDGAPLRDVREAFEDAARAQKRLAERVAVAKASGHTWSAIGAMLGTSGEAARQRYGVVPRKAAAKKAAPAKAAAPRNAAAKKAAPRKAGAKKASATKAAAKKPAPGKGTRKSSSQVTADWIDQLLAPGTALEFRDRYRQPNAAHSLR